MTNEVASLKGGAKARISEIVDKAIQQNSAYEKLDKDEMMLVFARLLNHVTPEKIIPLEDKELTNRIEGVLAIEAMSHLLDDLTPNQKEIFFQAVEGR